MNRLRMFCVFPCVCLLAVWAPASTQTYRLEVLNQSIAGTTLQFDICLLRTGSTPHYLGNCDLVLTFTPGYFTKPEVRLVSSGLPASYSIAAAILGPDKIVVNIGMPSFSNQAEFDQRVANVSATGNGLLLGSFQVTTIAGVGSTVGLRWRNGSPNKTIITALANAAPWKGTSITDSASHITPDASPLTVTLASFSAHADGYNAHIVWRTLNETCNLGFFVQRRGEGGTFADVRNGFVAGMGTSGDACDYAFVDSTVPGPGRYYYRLRQVGLDSVSHYTAGVAVDIVLVAVIEPAPREFMVHQNYPNPFNPETRIQFTVEKSGRVELSVYDITGREVTTLFDGVAEPGGTYSVTMDGKGLASGIYLYRLQSDEKTVLKKMLLLK